MFFNEKEKKITNQFLKNGYVINKIENLKNFHKIQETFIKFVSKYDNDISNKNIEKKLNNFHHKLDVKNLNKFRLDLYNTINNKNNFKYNYYSLAEKMLSTLVGNELAIQTRVNLSIQFPNDESSILPIHSDVWSGDSPFEVVLWVPLVNCYKTKTMFLLPPSKKEKLNNILKNNTVMTSEELFKKVKKYLIWIEIKSGEYMIFNQTLPHGNVKNTEKETRWSMNCRFKSLFSPYGDKKIGEFFEPLTIRAASQIGINYNQLV